MTVAPTPVRSRRAPLGYWPALTAVSLIILAALAFVVLVRSDRNAAEPNTAGSGVSATQTRDLASFTTVELAGSNQVTIHVGDKRSVLVTADDNLINHVTTEVQAGDLVIANTPGSFTTVSPMRVEVTVPSLESVTLSGTGSIALTGIAADSLTVTMPGVGYLRAKGHASQLDVSLSGSGNIQLSQLVASDVHALVDGSGQIVVTATKTLDASLSGVGAIVYGGDPTTVTKSVTGTGAISTK